MVYRAKVKQDVRRIQRNGEDHHAVVDIVVSHNVVRRAAEIGCDLERVGG